MASLSSWAERTSGPLDLWTSGRRIARTQGDLLMYRGLYYCADAVYQESLQVCNAVQIRALTLLSLGILAQRQERLALARERLGRALTLVQGKWLSLQSPILAALGRVAGEEGDPVEIVDEALAGR